MQGFLYKDEMKIDWTKYKAVIFDFDGTLYDGKGFGKNLVLADLWNCINSKRERIARKKLAGHDFGSSKEFYKAYFGILGEKKRKWYFDTYLPLMVKVLNNKHKARHKAQALIDILTGMGKTVGVLSDYPMIKERLAAINLKIDEKFLWSSETKGALKPAGRPFCEIANELGISPTDVLIIGDRIDTDYMGAQNANMDSIIIKTHKNETLMKEYSNIMEWDEIINSLQ